MEAVPAEVAFRVAVAEGVAQRRVSRPHYVVLPVQVHRQTHVPETDDVRTCPVTSDR